ncbi:MAG: methyltransferase domain-containing protein [Planctomycetaceae bacterium]|nr:methyltransferase domain-containing protein [Planctomycetaceae bacterium]
MSSQQDFPETELQVLLRLHETPEILAAIRDFQGTELQLQHSLRGSFDQALVRAALSVHEARCHAQHLLPQASRLWLTGIGLQQSTAWSVAAHKAKRFAGVGSVVDCCCGIGVDATAIAQYAAVDAIDLNPAMRQRCEWNATAWAPPHPVTVRCADVTQLDFVDRYVHADPDRRGERTTPTKRLEFYQPNLQWMQQLTRTARGGAIKISPAANFMQKFPGCEIELISLDGECREATVWFGELAGESSFRATILPSGESVSADPLSAWASQSDQVKQYLYDPYPAVVRSGMLDVVAEQLQLERLDPEEEYLTGDHLVDSGFLTAFEVEGVFSKNLKDVGAYLRKAPSTHYEVKCRRIPTDARTVQRRLPVGDEPPRVLIICRVGGRAATVLAHRIPRASD